MTGKLSRPKRPSQVREGSFSGWQPIFRCEGIELYLYIRRHGAVVESAALSAFNPYIPGIRGKAQKVELPVFILHPTISDWPCRGKKPLTMACYAGSVISGQHFPSRLNPKDLSLQQLKTLGSLFCSPGFLLMVRGNFARQLTGTSWEGIRYSAWHRHGFAVPEFCFRATC